MLMCNSVLFLLEKYNRLCLYLIPRRRENLESCQKEICKKKENSLHQNYYSATLTSSLVKLFKFATSLSPSIIFPTPSGVPVKIKSPTCKVKIFDKYEINFSTEKSCLKYFLFGEGFRLFLNQIPNYLAR